MKKIVFSLLATIAMGLSVQTASAWIINGHLEKLSAHKYICEPGGGYCSQSVDPNDPSPSVGDHIKIKYPDRGEERAEIIGIDSSFDPAVDNGSPAMDVSNELTGEVDHIVTDRN